MAMLTYLKPVEIEVILLHELMHIKNKDYFINFLQQTLSAILFFNPFAHVINKLIATDREYICDDQVLHFTGQPLVYATALLKLEKQRTTHLSLTIAATNNRMDLLTRVKRMIEPHNAIINFKHFGFTLMLLLISLASISWLRPSIKGGHLSFDRVERTTNLIKRSIKNAWGTEKQAGKANYSKNSKGTISPSYLNSTIPDTTKFNDTTKLYFSDKKGFYSGNAKTFNDSSKLYFSDKNDLYSGYAKTFKDSSRLYFSDKKGLYSGNAKTFKDSSKLYFSDKNGLYSGNAKTFKDSLRLYFSNKKGLYSGNTKPFKDSSRLYFSDKKGLYSGNEKTFKDSSKLYFSGNDAQTKKVEDAVQMLRHTDAWQKYAGIKAALEKLRPGTPQMESLKRQLKEAETDFHKTFEWQQYLIKKVLIAGLLPLKKDY